MKTMREHIMDTISDAVLDFFVYDRKEDDDLPVGAIEKEIEEGRITLEEIIAYFEKCLRGEIGAK